MKQFLSIACDGFPIYALFFLSLKIQNSNKFNDTVSPDYSLHIPNFIPSSCSRTIFQLLLVFYHSAAVTSSMTTLMAVVLLLLLRLLALVTTFLLPLRSYGEKHPATDWKLERKFIDQAKTFNTTDTLTKDCVNPSGKGRTPVLLESSGPTTSSSSHVTQSR